jgi:ankyrin repeat protein
MPDRILPERPSLEQYKKQAKELARGCAAGHSAALTRVRRHHPRLRDIAPDQPHSITLADAQLVIAREHNFVSWPRFAAQIETLHMIRSLESLADPLSTFIEVASVDLHGWHASGTLDYAAMILSRYPGVATANIYAAALLGDEATVRGILKQDPSVAGSKGGPHQWDALTYLCFSRYLRLDKSRSDGFTATARLLLEAGASANACWWDTIDDPPRRVPETAIYGAAGLARHPGLTRLLLEHGADPNDEETPYHVAEGSDNTVLRIILESGRFNQRSLATLLARKADWHEEQGLQLALRHGADPNYQTTWKVTPFQHSIRRDNAITMIEMFLEHGADPYIRNNKTGHDSFQMAAHQGRGDVLHLLQSRGFAPRFDQPLDALVAACATADLPPARSLLAEHPDLFDQLVHVGGALLARFAGVGNLPGVRCLLDLGLAVDALWPEGDPFFDEAGNSTALHVAAWRSRHDVVRELISRGASVHAIDGRGRTPLQLAVKACVDSYWKNRRQPDSVAALLAAGAVTDGIELPSGYDAVDTLLMHDS